MAANKKGRPRFSPREINLDAPENLGPEVFDYKIWTQESLCEGDDTDQFFAAATILVSKVQCGKCPVQNECLIWALIYNEQGVWGGTTDEERKSLSLEVDVESLRARAISVDQYYRRPTSIQEIQNLLSPVFDH